MTKYKLGVVIFANRDAWLEAISKPSDNDEPLQHRYTAIGIENAKGFTGWVQDYCGGGSWEEHFFLNGKDLADDDAETLPQEDYWYEIDKAYPGLKQQINRRKDKLVKWSNELDCAVAPTKLVLAYLRKTKKSDDVYCLGSRITKPPVIGLSWFD